MTSIDPTTLALVGIDLETGGLDGYQEIDGQRVHGAMHYPILEVGILVVVPNGNDSGTPSIRIADQFAVGIKPSEEDLARMHPWAVEQHTKSGLLQALCTGDQHDYVAESLADAERYIIERLHRAGAPAYDRQNRTGSVVFGNSVSFDMNFINAQMPSLAQHFHYRKIDVSSIDMLRRSVWSELPLSPPDKQYAHTALEDIRETFAELLGYTEQLKSGLPQ